MWMRSCAVCKAILHKLRLCDSVRCQCGGPGRTKGVERTIGSRGSEVKESVMAKVIEFYVPKNFQSRCNWVPQLQLGKVIEFRSEVKKSA